MAKKKAKKKTTPRKKRPSEIRKAEAKAKATPEVVPYPQAGRKIKDFEDQLDLQLAAGSEPRRGRSRPRKDAQPEPAEDQVGPALELVINFVKLPFELWQIRTPEVTGLALTDSEAKQIGEPARELIEYYLPRVPPIAWAWASLGVSGFWIMRTRLIALELVRKQKQSASSAPPAGYGTEPKKPGQGSPGPSVKMPNAAEITEQIKSNQTK